MPLATGAQLNLPERHRESVESRTTKQAAEKTSAPFLWE